LRESLEPQHVTSKAWYVRAQNGKNDVLGKQLLLFGVVLVWSCCYERATESENGEEEEGLNTVPRRPQHLTTLILMCERCLAAEGCGCEYSTEELKAAEVQASYPGMGVD
jgi:hypothetical protein